MYTIFDYVFFRAYDFYKKRSSDIPIDRGIQVISIIQIFFIFSLLMVIDFCFDIINCQFANKFLLGLPVAILVLIVNETRYKRMAKKNQFLPLFERWENEKYSTRKLRGIIIVILPVFLLFGVPVILWTIRHFFL